MHAQMTCGLKVDTSDPEWYKSMTKVLKKIKGASYTINVEEGMAYITGRVNPSKLLKELNFGKYADLCWVRSGNQITYDNNAFYQGIGHYGFDGRSPAAGYWHNHYEPMPMLHYHPQRPPMAYSHHNSQPYGYWDRSMRRWDY